MRALEKTEISNAGVVKNASECRAEKGCGREAPPRQGRYRLSRSPDRAAERAHQQPLAAFRGEQEGSPLAPWPPEDGQQAAQAAGLPQAVRPGPLHQADHRPRSAPLDPALP